MNRLTLFTVMLVAIFLSFSYYVVPVRATEPSLNEVFNHLGFTNVAETTVETFPAGIYNITLYAEFAGYCDENELSYYKVDTDTFDLIFTGPDGGSGYPSPPLTRIFTANYQFGLSMLSPGPHRYYTETSKNPDNEKHAKVFINLDDPKMFLIGFENLYAAGDRDYNDMVFSLHACSLPVGGMEVSLAKSAAKAPLTCYTILLAAVGTTISLIRRKRKFEIFSRPN